MILLAQRRDFDCGVASLAMLYRVPYEDVYAAAVAVVTNGKRLRAVGLHTYDLQTIAKRFQRPLSYLHYRRVDLDTQIGILSINYTSGIGHWVVLHQGTILDPTDAEVWDADEYVKQPGTRHGGLLIET